MVANDGIANLQKSYTENLIFFFCAKIMYPCPVPPIWLLIFKGGCTKLLWFCSGFALVQLPLSKISKRGFFYTTFLCSGLPLIGSYFFTRPRSCRVSCLSVRSLFVSCCAFIPCRLFADFFLKNSL